jgi:pentatricopeptide repeat protein
MIAQSLTTQHKNKKAMLMMVSLICPVILLRPAKMHVTAISPQTQHNDNGISLDHLTILCKQGRLKEALIILNTTSSCVDSSGYLHLLQACIQKKALTEAKIVHAHINERRLMGDSLLSNTLISLYVKCRSLADARRVFDEMSERDVCSWTVMIAGYAKHGPPQEALVLFRRMRETGVQSNQFTFASILPACINLGFLDQGMEIHEEIIKDGFQSDVVVSTALVDMYAKCGSLEDARKVFGKMPERDLVSWNAMIAGYAQNGNVDEAFKLFSAMPQRDVVSWNVVIAGFAHNGYGEEALRLFQQMQLDGMRPDSQTFASTLPACANFAALEQGTEIHEKIIRSGFQSDMVVANALIDMYAKSGSIQKARELFDKMNQRDVVSWTSMIAGYAIHGCGKEALKLFELMKHSGVCPNHVTFVSILTACSHAGLVDEGYAYFNCMSKYYNVTPGMEHYRCMVDLLGRAGHLSEAQEFINKMQVKPDPILWICLLSACSIHNNIELGESVAERLFVLYPDLHAPYILLSNIYAAVGRWDDIQKIRKMMRHKGIKKTPGCSWIEVDKQVHAFLVGDSTSPQTEKVYTKMERLSW